MSKRIIAALRRQRERIDRDRALWGDVYEAYGLVFARENGAPVRPEYVLRRFRALADAARAAAGSRARGAGGD